jgi:hypothetical protein
VASKKTLDAQKLAALGAERLAELLIELGTGDATVARRIRLELAGAQSPEKVANEVRKRLAAIARARSFVDWQHRKPLVNDLEAQRQAIVTKVAPADPAEALDLMWRFLALANSVFARSDDSSGTLIGIFHGACGDLAAIAKTARPSPEELARRVFEALLGNKYGQYDSLIEVLGSALGPAGLNELKGQFVALSKLPRVRPKEQDRKVIGWGGGGALYADDIAERQQESAVRFALEQIADAQGDVDGFIAQQSGQAKSAPAIAVKIAERLLKAGRAQEAWSAINAVDQKHRGWIPYEWEDMRLQVMEALGRTKEAQAFRWQCFERTLSSAHLRAYLKRLPEFDDIEAEQRAIATAMKFQEVHQALAFLVSWPALEKAAALVLSRARELNGDLYETLSPAADALAGKYPLAATLLLRAMIDFSLKHNRTGRYRHAARHLAECQSLAAGIPDFGQFESDEPYRKRLKAEHGRKTSFWAVVV